MFVAVAATFAGITVALGTAASAAIEPKYAWRAERFDYSETGYFFDGGSVEVADVTGDGREDIVVGLNEGPLQFVGVQPRLAGGGFGDVILTPVANPEEGRSWVKVVTADLDDDGDIDVAVQGGSGLDLLFQKPDGTLGNHRLLEYYGALPADWDADGDIDLVTQRAVEGGAVLSLLTRQGDGSWSGADLTTEPENTWGLL